MVLVGVPAVGVPLVVILRDGLYWVVGVPQFGVPLEVFLDGLNLIPGPDDGEDNFGLVVLSSSFPEFLSFFLFLFAKKKQQQLLHGKTVR